MSEAADANEQYVVIGFEERQRLSNRPIRHATRHRSSGSGLLWLERPELHEIPLVRHQEIFGIASIMLGETDPLRPVA